jgi:hypothetical protein
MLKIDPKILLAIAEAEALSDLFPLVQSAIELEHSTIPPYLTALFSFRPGKGTYIRTVIHSIVIEEMLHMTIAANILNAIGGSPDINKKDFIPEYKCHLPMGIQKSLQVGLEAYSKDVVSKVFMEIESPEKPLVMMAAEGADEYKTIGEFYTALQKKIYNLAPDILPGDKSKQVTSDFYSSALLFPIITKSDAIKAITIIVEQGEGTTTSPADFDSEIAHYYKFEELFKGHQLIKDPKAPYGYSFTGDLIPFDPADVFPLFANTKAVMIQEGTEERRRADEFNKAYSSLLGGLHRTFNGDPDYLANSIGVMFDLRLAAEKLCATPFPGKTGYTIGPPFEWVP